MPSHRRTPTALSNEVLNDWSACAARTPENQLIPNTPPAPSKLHVEPSQPLTLPVVLRKHLVMLPPDLRPLGKLVLRAGGVHLALQAHDLAPQRGLGFHVGGRGRRELVVEDP